jgi:hypothetical protein
MHNLYLAVGWTPISEYFSAGNNEIKTDDKLWTACRNKKSFD